MSYPDREHPRKVVGWGPLGKSVFRRDSPVTALSLSRGATSLYLTGLDGQVWSNFFPQGGQNWSGWFALGPNTFPLGSEVAARSEERRVGKSVDLGGRRIIKRKRRWTNSL